MSTLTLRVQTPCPGFANDVADVVRIFLGALEFSVSAPDAHDEAPCGLTVLHMEESCGGRTICRVRRPEQVLDRIGTAMSETWQAHGARLEGDFRERMAAEWEAGRQAVAATQVFVGR